MKRCSGCRREKPADQFSKGKAQCKECVKLRLQKWTAQRRLLNHPVGRERVPYLPIGPWRGWLQARYDEILERRRRDPMYRHASEKKLKDGIRDMVADMISVHEREVFRWMRESRNIRLDTLDRVLCDAEMVWLLDELYPAVTEDERQVA